MMSSSSIITQTVTAIIKAFSVPITAKRKMRLHLFVKEERLVVCVSYVTIHQWLSVHLDEIWKIPNSYVILDAENKETNVKNL